MRRRAIDIHHHYVPREAMEKGRIAMAALDPNTNSVGYPLEGNARRLLKL